MEAIEFAEVTSEDRLLCSYCSIGSKVSFVHLARCLPWSVVKHS